MTSSPRDLEQQLAAHIKAYAATRDPYAIEHDVQVTSFGGAGTTALVDHLGAQGVVLPPGPGHWPFKHRRQPPTVDQVPDGFRVVYLLGDPRNAVVSLFRRHYQFGHFAAMHGREPDPAQTARLESLETFAAAGEDDFAIADHLDGWMAHPTGYPVAFVRYEHLAAVWPELAEFVGLPASPALAVRPRRSRWDDLDEPVRNALDSLYGPLARRIEAMPPFQIIE